MMRTERPRLSPHAPRTSPYAPRLSSLAPRPAPLPCAAARPRLSPLPRAARHDLSPLPCLSMCAFALRRSTQRAKFSTKRNATRCAGYPARAAGLPSIQQADRRPARVTQQRRPCSFHAAATSLFVPHSSDVLVHSTQQRRPSAFHTATTSFCVHPGVHARSPPPHHPATSHP